MWGYNFIMHSRPAQRKICFYLNFHIQVSQPKKRVFVSQFKNIIIYWLHDVDYNEIMVHYAEML
jgi:hypothetical protein